ncbi:hypothetical protein ACQ27_gp232 [Klebsiella phage K64-1]|uniref:hypothetical protein n=1 Tax=Klebsiella phage K64-1 TaxID=1439894 RepID=UPI00248CDD18|nr:hypothetical protein ACQ27_gp232 [Klebsiella phage K64-1]
MVNEHLKELCSLWKSSDVKFEPVPKNKDNWHNSIVMGSCGFFLLPMVLKDKKIGIVVLYNDLIYYFLYEDEIQYVHNNMTHTYKRDTTHEELFQLSTLYDEVIQYENLIEVFNLYDSVMEVIER